MVGGVQVHPAGPGEPGHLTVGDEVRLLYHRYWNNQFGSAVKPDEDYLPFRALPYADLHLGPHFRAFGQIMVAYADSFRASWTGACPWARKAA